MGKGRPHRARAPGETPPRAQVSALTGAGGDEGQGADSLPMGIHSANPFRAPTLCQGLCQALRMSKLTRPPPLPSGGLAREVHVNRGFNPVPCAIESRKPGGGPPQAGAVSGRVLGGGEIPEEH